MQRKNILFLGLLQISGLPLVVSFTPSGLPLSVPSSRTSCRPACVSVSMQQKTSGSFDRRGLISILGAGAIGAAVPQDAFATEREVGSIPASGIIFKDEIKITAFEDPKVKGVALYVSDFQRPITERLQKNFFSDPTQASVACAKIGKITLANDINKSKEGEEVFEQARSLLFKTVRIRRIYDVEAQTLIYVSYSTRLNKDDDDNNSRFKTTTCAIPINDY